MKKPLAERTITNITYVVRMEANTKYGAMRKDFEASSVERLKEQVKEYLDHYKDLMEITNIEFGKVLKKESLITWKEECDSNV